MGHVFNYNLPLDKGGEGGVDTSQDTVTPETLLEGVTAHDADGNEIEGLIPTYYGSIEQGAVEGAQIKYDEGFSDGKQSEYDAFWDAFQQNGSKKSYSCAFAGDGWSVATFKPKHNIVPTNGYMMFRENGINADLQEILDGLGIIFDTSACTTFSYFIYGSKIKRIGVIDFTFTVTISYSLAYNSYLKTIDKVILSPNNKFDSTFIGDTALQNLTIEGTIGQNGFNTSWSPLSRASIESIIAALSSTTTGLTVTLRKAAVDTAFETAQGVADGSTSEAWLNLIATKSNWAIELINS